MKRAIFFVLLLLPEFFVFSQNLVLNPGFEIWETATKPAEWIKADNCLGNSSILYSGIFSCQHSGGASSRSDLGQTIAVLPGKEYLLSYFNKTLANTGSGSRIWCFWKDLNLNNITDLPTEPLLRPGKYLKNETWQQFSVDITAPQNAFYFYLEVRTYPNSVAYWDDFVFEEKVATHENREELSEIVLYPNPAHNYLNISNLHNLQRIDIQDITGIIVWTSDFSGEKTVSIPLSRFSENIYIIRIRTKERLITKKFIKE
jgi:hypothetical protein